MSPVRGQVDAALTVLGEHGLAGRSVAARVRVFTGQLRAAVETARTGAGEGREPEPDDVRGVARLRDPVAVLRANLSPDAAVLRHAVRAAVLVAGSDAVVRLTAVPRGYWIPLTIMVTLRPDFATTFQRSSMRVAGTIVGLVLATVLVHFVPGGQWWGVALVGLFFFGVRFAGPGNIALLAVSLAALVVVLLSLAGQSPHSTVLPRGVNTLVGERSRCSARSSGRSGSAGASPSGWRPCSRRTSTTWARSSIRARHRTNCVGSAPPHGSPAATPRRPWTPHAPTRSPRAGRSSWARRCSRTRIASSMPCSRSTRYAIGTAARRADRRLPGGSRQLSHRGADRHGAQARAARAPVQERSSHRPAPPTPRSWMPATAWRTAWTR